MPRCENQERDLQPMEKTVERQIPRLWPSLHGQGFLDECFPARKQEAGGLGACLFGDRTRSSAGRVRCLVHTWTLFERLYIPL